jgi:hypothetical protein
VFDPIISALFRGIALGMIFLVYQTASPEKRVHILSWFEKHFLPDPAVEKRHYTKATNVLIVTSGLLLIVVSLPPMMWLLDTYVIAPETQSWLSANKAYFKSWTSWLSTALEIGIILFLGGAIFGERATKAFKEVLETYEQERNAFLANRKTELSKKIQDLDAKIVSALNGRANTLSRFQQFYQSANELRDTLFGSVPRFQQRLITARFLVSFPGGSHGLVAFVLFVMLTVLKVVGLYIDGPWIP